MLIEIENAVLSLLQPLQSPPYSCRVQTLNLGLYGPTSASSLYFSYKDTESSVLSFNVPRHDIVRFELILLLGDQRTHARAYPILEKARQLLEEFDPVPPLTIERFQMVQQVFRDDFLPDFWVYQQLWRTALLFVAN